MISYTITACNEEQELLTLIDTLSPHINDDDELIIQFDADRVTDGVREVVDQYLEVIKNMIVVEFPLANDFSSFKNNLKRYCTKKWIFNLDADEIPSVYLLENIKNILTTNERVDMFLLPRWNTVFGITPEHVKRWGWASSPLFDRRWRASVT